MLKTFLKTSLRNLRRNKATMAINVLSLTIGMAAAIVVFVVIRYHYSFDHSQPKADRIYRVNYTLKSDRGMAYRAQTPEPLHYALRENYPQVETVGRTLGPVSSTLYIDNEKYAQDGVLYANPDFLDLFEYQWISGDPETALNDPKAVILTQSSATKFFGSEDPMGRTIDFQHKDQGIVRGVIKDMRRNTNLPFKLLVNAKMLDKVLPYFVFKSWEATSVGITWVLLPKNVEPRALEGQLEALVTKYFDKKYHGSISFNLLSLKKLHTEDRYGNAMNYTIPSETIYGLLAIGSIVLLTCCINFINLSTAMALKRAKEVGVKKIMGSSRRQLMKQYFIELGMVVALAGFIALWLAELGLNEINNLLSLASMDMSLQTDAFLFTIALILSITLLAGSYPVLRLSRFKAATVLRTGFSNPAGKRFTMRNILLGLQFVFSQILVVVLLVFNQQFSFIENKDLGYATENIMTFDNFSGSSPAEINKVKQELMKDPAIEMVSFGTGGPNALFSWGTTVTDPTDPEREEINADYKHVDIDYHDLFELEMMAGNWFVSSNYLADTLQKVVVNEALVQELGLKNPDDALNYPVIVNGSSGRITGVVKNFHSRNLKLSIRPSIIEADFEGYQQGFIKYRPGSYAKVASLFEKVSTDINPGYVPSYQNYEDELAEEYLMDEIIFRFINFMTLVAIVIGCLGLYSLVSFIAQQKTKEIGIRKVVGASVSNIIVLITRQFIWIVLFAFLIAAPIGYAGSDLWLQGFEYRVSVGPVIFLMAIAFTLMVSFVSVGHRSLKAAKSNPIKSLRYE